MLGLKKVYQVKIPQEQNLRYYKNEDVKEI